MKINKNFYVMFVLLFLIITSLSIWLFNLNNDYIKVDKNSLILNNKIDKNMFAIMVQKEDGSGYEESNTVPSDGVLNLEKSGCLDANGNLIDGALTYENGFVNAEIEGTAYCYLFFDHKPAYSFAQYLIDIDILADNNSSDTGLQREFEGKDTLYRFSGTSGNQGINNYVCLGVTSKCTKGSDDMYRIIGVDPETGYVKMIKETKYTTKTYTYSSATGTTWSTSTTWTVVNSNWLSGISFRDMLVEAVWNVGFATSILNTRSEMYDLEATKTTNGYAGILSLTDYYMAYKSDQNWGTNYSNYGSNWINSSNSGTNFQEWTMSMRTESEARYITTAGNATGGYINGTRSLRPTFYLSEKVEWESGTGTADDPFMVSLNEKPKSVIATSSFGEHLLRNDIVGLEKKKIDNDTLYRFSGTSGNNYINNYVCLGVTSKCTKGSDNMYRIIGVNPDTGYVKMIKETRYTTKTYTYSSATGITWPTSTTWTVVNSNWLSGINFRDMLVEEMWNVGFATSVLDTRSEMYDLEATETTNGYAGILSLTDYYMAYRTDQNWGFYYSNYGSNWINLSNGDTNVQEWTMSMRTESEARYITTVGNATGGYINGTRSLRPTFYLNDKVVWKSGTGTADDPFMVELKKENVTIVESNNFGEHLIYNKITGLHQEFIGDDNLYRFSGTSGNNYINNYVCLGVTSKCAKGSNDMYRIIGVEPDTGYVKMIKESRFTTSTYKYSSAASTTWPTSTAWTIANSNWLSTNPLFIKMVIEHSWDVGLANSVLDSREEMYAEEAKTPSTSKVGILSLSDYYMAYRTDQNWGRYYSNYGSNWINISNGDTNVQEWTMTMRTASEVRYITTAGNATGGSINGTLYLRPTFYLSDKVVWKSGTGTPEDPFMVELST